MIQKIEFKAMGSQMMAALDSGTESNEKNLMLVPAWFEEWEQSLSRFRINSELSRLNRTPDKIFHTSDTLMSVMKLSLEIHKQSGGLVTPAVLNDLEKAGYLKDFNQLGISAMQSKSEFTSNPDVDEIVIDERNKFVIIPNGLRLDFSGVAKGWAAQQVIMKLQEFGPSLMDAGGDIMTSSALLGGDPWPVSIADPFSPEMDLEILYLAGNGVATSGQDYRFWNLNGIRMHHIIDIRTGRPAKSDVYTATIVAPTAIEAEMAAKVVLIMGSDEGYKWLESQPHYAGLIVRMDKSKLVSKRISCFIRSKTCQIQ